MTTAYPMAWPPKSRPPTAPSSVPVSRRAGLGPAVLTVQPDRAPDERMASPWEEYEAGNFARLRKRLGFGDTGVCAEALRSRRRAHYLVDEIVERAGLARAAGLHAVAIDMFGRSHIIVLIESELSQRATT